MRWEDRTDREKVELLKVALEKVAGQFLQHQHGAHGETLIDAEYLELDYSDEGTEE